MHRYPVSHLDPDKAYPGSYRIGAFLISRAGSRWRVRAQDAAVDKEFATLGGALAWCRHQLALEPASSNGSAQR
jgi:hypothetical protein